MAGAVCVFPVDINRQQDGRQAQRNKQTIIHLFLFSIYICAN